MITKTRLKFEVEHLQKQIDSLYRDVELLKHERDNPARFKKGDVVMVRKRGRASVLKSAVVWHNSFFMHIPKRLYTLFLLGKNDEILDAIETCEDDIYEPSQNNG